MTTSNPVFVEKIKLDEIMVIVRELRATGLVQGRDFDFKYQPGQYQWSLYEDRTVTPKGVEFYFSDPKRTTFFRLKYGNRC